MGFMQYTGLDICIFSTYNATCFHFQKQNTVLTGTEQ